MKAKTKEGKRLLRLVQDFSLRQHLWWQRGGRPPEEWPEMKQKFDKARERLEFAIDQLTSIDLTPRAVIDGD